jgi:hypothetical protein
MRTKIRIINGEKYTPVSKKVAKILEKSGIEFYRVGDLKTLFIKVNDKNRKVGKEYERRF